MIIWWSRTRCSSSRRMLFFFTLDCPLFVIWGELLFINSNTRKRPYRKKRTFRCFQSFLLIQMDKFFPEMLVHSCDVGKKYLGIFFPLFDSRRPRWCFNQKIKKRFEALSNREKYSPMHHNGRNHSTLLPLHTSPRGGRMKGDTYNNISTRCWLLFVKRCTWLPFNPPFPLYMDMPLFHCQSDDGQLMAIFNQSQELFKGHYFYQRYLGENSIQQ